MFDFTATGNFRKKASRELYKEGNFAEEGNFPTKGIFAREESSPRTASCREKTTLPQMATTTQ
jgi:hypothetical protein